MHRDVARRASRLSWCMRSSLQSMVGPPDSLGALKLDPTRYVPRSRFGPGGRGLSWFRVGFRVRGGGLGFRV